MLHRIAIIDIMVVEEKPPHPIRGDVDLLVVSDEKFEYWRETPGNVYYEAATAGQVLYQAA